MENLVCLILGFIVIAIALILGASMAGFISLPALVGSVEQVVAGVVRYFTSLKF